MSTEKLKADLEFSAKQGPDFAVITTQEAVRAAIAEAEAIYLTNDGSLITGERAAELYDDEKARGKKVADEAADLRAEVARLREALTKTQKHAEGMWSELVDSGFADASTVPAFRMYAEKSSQVKS